MLQFALTFSLSLRQPQFYMFQSFRKKLLGIHKASKKGLSLANSFDGGNLYALDRSDFEGPLSALICLSANVENPIVLSAIALADRGLAEIYVRGACKFITPNLIEFPEAFSRAQRYAVTKFGRSFNELAQILPPSDQAIVNRLKSLAIRSIQSPLLTSELIKRRPRVPPYTEIKTHQKKFEAVLRDSICSQLDTLDARTKSNEVVAVSSAIFQGQLRPLSAVYNTYLSESLAQQGAARIITLAHFRFFGFEPSSEALNFMMGALDHEQDEDAIVRFIVSKQNYLLFTLGDELKKREVGHSEGSAAMSRLAMLPSEKTFETIIRDLDLSAYRANLNRSQPTAADARTRTFKDHTVESPSTVVIVQGVTAQIASVIESKFDRSNVPRLARLIVYAAGKGGVSIAHVLSRLEIGEEPEQILDCLKVEARKQKPIIKTSVQQDQAHRHFEEAVEVLGAKECRMLVIDLAGKGSFLYYLDTQLSTEERRQVIGRLGRLAYGSTGVTRAILNNFKATGVYELKWNSAMRVYYAQTAEDEYTILGISRNKEQQPKSAALAVQNFLALRDGKLSAIDLDKLLLTECPASDA